MLLVISCSKEDLSTPSHNKKSNPDNRFYGIKVPDVGSSTRSIAQKDKLWFNGTTLKVRFLNDPYNVKKEVEQYARQWEDHANITFKFVDSGDAHIRIGFDWNNKRHISWSYIGTDCKTNTNQNEATMSFAYFDDLSEEDRRADVLRAFGMVLGLELEHRHLDFDPGWTRRIESYWKGELSDIPWASLKNYVFDPIESYNALQTDEYDEESIMVWPFLNRYAKNTARDFNKELSKKDIEFIKKLYPREQEVIVRMVVKTNEVKLGILNSEEVIVDWGDGNKETRPKHISVNEYYPNFFSHYYKDSSTYIVKIIGNREALIIFTSYHNGMVELDVSKNIRLKSLNCPYNYLTKLDLSNNLMLEEIDFTNNQLTELDVSNNIYRYRRLDRPRI